MFTTLETPGYFLTPNTELWYLTQTGDAFVWADTETTAAMSAQISLVCEPLRSQLSGLPSFTALLMTVGAITKPWDDETASRRIAELTRCIGSLQDSVLPPSDRDQLLRWLVCLNSQVPSGQSARQTFISRIVESLPSYLIETDAVNTSDAFAWLKTLAGQDGVVISMPMEKSVSRCVVALETLKHLSKVRINSDSIQLLEQTSLEELPSETRRSDSDDAYTTFLTALKGDADFGAVAAMALNSAATISLPRRAGLREELPLGGVSDIVNHGHPERLLMTELAADTDLLMARIVNHQALYLRRESPPEKQSEQRTVLIENGVRTWGMTRVRATAFAMAVAASEESHQQNKLSIYTVAGDNYWNESLSTRTGLAEQLSRLEPSPHPASAIVRLLWQTEDAAGEQRAEPLLILAANTYADRSFRDAIKALPFPYLVATIDLMGKIKLVRRTAFGDDLLHQQQMVWQENPSIAKLQTNRELPILLQQRPCPLRFATDLYSSWSVGFGHVIWKITGNKRLLYFDQSGFGAVDLTSLPSDRILASEAIDAKTLRLVVEEPIDSATVRHLLVRVCVGEEVQAIELKTNEANRPGSSVTFGFDQGLVVRAGQQGEQTVLYDAESGIEVANGVTRGAHLGGAFFGRGRVYLATASQGRIQWESLSKTLGRNLSLAGFAVRSPEDCPVVIAADLSWIVYCRGDNVNRIETGFKIETTSYPVRMVYPADESKVVLTYQDATIVEGGWIGFRHKSHCWKSFQVDLRQNSVRPLDAEDLRRSHPIVAGHWKARNARARIHGIGSNGKQVVLRRNDRYLALTYQPTSQCYSLIDASKTSGAIACVDFGDPLETKGRFRDQWELRDATVGNCHAWIDSRGLLHLRALDGSELSLVLNDRHVAGWHSRGLVFGPRYFTGLETDQSVPEEIVQWTEEFAAECLR